MLGKELATDGGTIRYWVSRLETEAKAPWLVFLPGLTADHRLFDKQLAHFEDKANCLAWDPPAHGQSRPFALGWSMDDLALMLRSVLENEAVERPVLVGQSMGGYVSQAYLDLFHGEAAGFVSIDSCPLGRAYYTSAELWALEHTRPMYLAIPWSVLLRIGSEGVSTTAYGRRLMRTMMSAYEKREYVDLADCGYRALAGAVRADRPYEPGCPTQLVCGERDAAGSARRYNRAWARKTGLPMEWLRGAGHNSNTDAPDLTNRIIEMFVANLGD